MLRSSQFRSSQSLCKLIDIGFKLSSLFEGHDYDAQDEMAQNSNIDSREICLYMYVQNFLHSCTMSLKIISIQ